MNRRQSIRLMLGAAALAALAVPGYAQQAADRPLWGQEMLTEEERSRFHLEMQNAQSEQERQRIREEHQALIRQRAKERGVQVPPGAGGSMGMGQGMAPGQGAGQGTQDLLRKKGKSN